jgi:hypothetical protein
VSLHSFGTLVPFLRQKEVIAVTKAVLRRIHMQCMRRHRSAESAVNVPRPEVVNVRVFLSGFMISFRPTHVFESMGPLETALLEASTPLMTKFNDILDSIQSNGSFKAVPSVLTADFLDMLCEFLERFKAWKIPDEAKLIPRFKHALFALYQAHSKLPANEPADSRLSIEFRIQIERLRNKLKTVAGADALQQFDEERLSGTIPDVPMGAFRGGAGGDGDAGGAAGIYTPFPERIDRLQLVHELFLDPNFRLSDSGCIGTENLTLSSIREVFQQAFWDSLVDDLRLATPCYVRVLRVLAEVRDGINDLAVNRMAGAASDMLDIDRITRQAEAGDFGWDGCVKLVSDVVDLIKIVQTPERDAETRARWQMIKDAMHAAEAEEQPRAFCKALEFLLNRVNVMRVDACNARLTAISGVVRDFGLNYLRDALKERLDQGTLERTQAWIRRSLDAEVTANAVDLNSLLSGDNAAFVRVHSMAMLDLVCGNDILVKETCPETLLFDVHRLVQLQSEIASLTTSFVMYATTEHGLMVAEGRDRTADQSVLRAVKEILITGLGADFKIDPAVEAIGKALESSSLTWDTRETLRTALQGSASPTNRVRMVT